MYVVGVVAWRRCPRQLIHGVLAYGGVFRILKERKTKIRPSIEMLDVIFHMWSL